jgi:hypothetical protein
MVKETVPASIGAEVGLTIAIESELKRRVKIRATELGKTLRQFVTEALEAQLAATGATRRQVGTSGLSSTPDGKEIDG